jgi:hypothetical protein
MIFDPATDTQMQAARIFGGATMLALLAAPAFRHRARQIRVAVATLYIAGVLAFLAYVLF